MCKVTWCVYQDRGVKAVGASRLRVVSRFFSGVRYQVGEVSEAVSMNMEEAGLGKEPCPSEP